MCGAGVRLLREGTSMSEYMRENTQISGQNVGTHLKRSRCLSGTARLPIVRSIECATMADERVYVGGDTPVGALYNVSVTLSAHCYVNITCISPNDNILSGFQFEIECLIDRFITISPR